MRKPLLLIALEVDPYPCVFLVSLFSDVTFRLILDNNYVATDHTTVVTSTTELFFFYLRYFELLYTQFVFVILFYDFMHFHKKNYLHFSELVIN